MTRACASSSEPCSGLAIASSKPRTEPRRSSLRRELDPDLIVLDVMLPGLSGIEVLETIRNDEKLKDMLVVVITAWSHAELDARVAGADRFVSKPFDPDELSGAVEELLG